MSSPSRFTTEISLAGMRFHARVGILDHERDLPQPLEVDLVVRRAAGADGVLDYRDLHEIVRSTVEAGPTGYLESLAERLMSGVLALEGVAWVRVALRKPHVALGGPLDYAQVVLEGPRG